MQHDLILVPETKGVVEAVLLPRFALDIMLEHEQSGVYDPESGGLILGRIRGEYLDIAEVTKPANDDFKSRFKFIRRDISHYQLAIEAWASSNSEVGYLGEWHTHPEDTPKPSSIDLASWKKIVRNGHSPYCFFVIVGLGSFYFCVGSEGDNGDTVFQELSERT
ncbi:Mov34/MPN/PAD-1 family protein [Cobetia marina]